MTNAAEKIAYYRKQVQDENDYYGKKYHKNRMRFFEQRIAKLEKYARLKVETIELSKQGWGVNQIHRLFLERGDTIHYGSLLRYRRVGGVNGRMEREIIKERCSRVKKEVLRLARTKSMSGVAIHRTLIERGENVPLYFVRQVIRDAGLQMSQRYWQRRTRCGKAGLKKEAIALARQGLGGSLIYRYFQSKGKYVRRGTVDKWLRLHKLSKKRSYSTVRRDSEGVALRDIVVELANQGLPPCKILEYFKNRAKSDKLYRVSLYQVKHWLAWGRKHGKVSPYSITKGTKEK